jgi:phosphatidylinositol 3-kinase
MENYILSCAGYCAITYFFAIGDRHLQNLLINDTGKIFHIDFGFILGKDPKPYPPPIKLRSEMVEAMGGRDSENFKKFKSKCL